MSERNGGDLESPEQDTHGIPVAGDHLAPAGAGGPRRGYDPTGNPMVDSVLESLDRLDDTPASEHRAVFESADETLRAALADGGNDESP